MADTSLVFEPHGGYGTDIDGEPMPFGYISGGHPRLPIFELNPILAIGADTLTKYAVLLAASDKMFAVLTHMKEAIDLNKEDMKPGVREYLLAIIDPAISAAEGR